MARLVKAQPNEAEVAGQGSVLYFSSPEKGRPGGRISLRRAEVNFLPSRLVTYERQKHAFWFKY